MVAIQSTLYVVAFILCWIGPTVFHLADWIAGFKSFWAVLVIVIFTPLQGFWNAIVFARPTYIRLRRKCPELKRLQVVKLIFFTADPVAATESLLSRATSQDVRSKRNLGRLIDDDSFAGDSSEDVEKGGSSSVTDDAGKEAEPSKELDVQEETTPHSITMVKGGSSGDSFLDNDTIKR